MRSVFIEGQMKSITVLVVDDYEPFRRFVRLLLQIRPELQILGEASDGLEAVQKARDLQPDLILLDVGLPTLDGIEAAQTIRTAAPKAKILFLSLESTSDIVQKALSVGAMGYVLKSRARTEALPAIEAVLADRYFVSSGLEVRESSEGPVAQSLHRHDVVFYSHETGFVEGLTDFIAAALRSGKVSIIVATKSHRESILRRLKRDCLDIDLDAAIREGTYIALDSDETLQSFMTNGVPDRDRLFGGVGGVMDSAPQSRTQEHGIAACGECAPFLLSNGEEEAAIRVEQLWDELTRTRGVDLLCAYPLSAFHGTEDESFKRICAEHAAVHFR